MHFEQKVSFDHYLSNTKLEHVFPDQPYSRDGGPMWGFFVKIIAFYKLFTLKKNKEEEQFCEVALNYFFCCGVPCGDFPSKSLLFNPCRTNQKNYSPSKNKEEQFC